MGEFFQRVLNGYDLVYYFREIADLVFFIKNLNFYLLDLLRGVKKVFFNLKYVCNIKEAKQVIELKKLVGSKHF